ncbi:coiled-coil domain-containing protein 102A isoform X1 [Metopolophium dirhodum]|uniref:coiled-coil domain-containing protein 102A isoform X1 n=2 Tax=Metopolophium dirhodum TaxID=44670 RepID=UPI00299007AA|nr:coiled-coil domain-containing protein 102A isoform X1 [Metopolophium dirhodum]
MAVKMAASEAGGVVASATASDWDTRESMRQRELDEARARATQMEKTMRWWSDCTANWREKWSKVRNERNKAREEAKMLKDNLEHVLKENSNIKREKQNLEQQNECLRKELEKVNLILLKHAGQWDSQLVDALENGISDPDTCCSSSSIPQPSIVSDSGIEEYVLQEAVPKHAVEMFNQTTSPIKSPTPNKTISDEVADTLEKNLENLLESTQQDLNNLHSQLSGTDSVKSECQTCQDNQVITNKRLEDLRIQLEHLQSENEIEWSKREQLESEMMNLERINKQLKSELNDTLDKLQKQSKPESSSDTKYRLLQEELADKNIELANLKHILSKQKKVCVDQSAESAHLVRRGEQYENEVKRLRSRVEELKRELATTEEDYDTASNTIKKLQRLNEDLQEKLDSLQAELIHQNIRLTRLTSRVSSDDSSHSDED